MRRRGAALFTVLAVAAACGGGGAPAQGAVARTAGVPGLLASAPEPAPARATASWSGTFVKAELGPEAATHQIVVAGVPRDAAVRNQRLYLVTEGGMTQISQDNTRWYDWPSFAMGGSRVVYTIRDQEPTTLIPTGQESVWMATVGGSAPAMRLTTNNWRDYQPKVTPDGSSMVFSSMWTEFPNVGLFRMNLSTFDVTNLSSRTMGIGASDADPRLSADGSRVIFAASLDPNGSERRTQIFSMRSDGSDRTRLSSDAYLDTDPTISPDGRYAVYSSYRGSVKPSTDHPLPGADWNIVLLDLQTGLERVLTKGLACVDRPDEHPCLPSEASGWVPIWSPDGSEIGFIGHLSRNHSGVFAIRPDGGNGHIVVDSGLVVPNYWDWVRPSAVPGAAARVGGAQSPARLLTGGRRFFSPAEQSAPLQLLISTRDGWNQSPIHTPTGQVVADFARWTPDRSHIVFTAKVDFDPSRPDPTPKPPPGNTRHEHYVFQDLVQSLQPAVRNGAEAAREQVFMMDPDGSNVRQLTTPWTEDWLEALPVGDLRANTDPDVSPDGRYLVFTNSSALTAESSVLRLDLHSGEVLNLTSITAGAMVTADSFPRFSPDGRRIAFSSASGSTLQIFVMGIDGSNPEQVTDDNFVNLQPAWAPDGSALVFTSYRGKKELGGADQMGAQMASNQLPIDGWDLVRVDLRTHATTLLVASPDHPAFRPVWSPDGSRIAYISLGAGGQPDVFTVSPAGGDAAALQTTGFTKEEFVDWR